jgi:hypothetical protein
MTVSTRLVTAALAVVLLAACSNGQQPADRAVLLDQQQIMAEYVVETARLQLPDDAAWDPRPAELSGDAGQGHMFEVGVGAQTAHFHWYCAWARAALASGPGRSAALSQLATFPELGVWQAMDDTGHTMFEAILGQARAGSLDDLGGYVASNCQQDR